MGESTLTVSDGPLSRPARWTPMYHDELHDILTDLLDRLLILAALALLGGAGLYGASRLMPGLPRSVEAAVTQASRYAAAAAAASRQTGTAVAAAAVEHWQSVDE